MTDDTRNEDLEESVCVKCGQEVVKPPRSFFWRLRTEAGQRMVTSCPEGGSHDGSHEEDDEEDDE